MIFSYFIDNKLRKGDLMFKIINQSGHTAYGLKEYVCDNDSDISNLSIDDTPGSTAFVIATQKVFMLNNQHQWIDITNPFSSDSSGSTSSEFIDYTENFNELKEKVATLIVDNAVLKTQINDLTAKNQTLSDNIELLNNNIVLLLEENKILSNSVNVLTQEIQNLKIEIEALKESHEEDKDGGEVYIEGTMNMDKIPVEINEETNTLKIDTSNSEIKGNTLVIK